MLNIRTIYYTAGNQYNWLKDGYSLKGVGIKADYIMGEGVFKFIAEGDEYMIDKKVAYEFVKKYNSIHRAKNTFLGVIPMSILTKISPVKNNNVRQMSLI